MIGRDRFWDKVDVGHPLGCWLWTASTRNGYGQCSVDGVNQYAHRVAYILLVGPIPEGLDLDHLCRTRLCVNPDHLKPVTRAENARRGATGRYPRSGLCKRGHLLVPARGQARKVCPPCKRDNERRRRAQT